MDYKFHLPPQLQPSLLANFFLCYILTHLPQFYALYLCTFGMIHTSCRILNLLDTFFFGGGGESNQNAQASASRKVS